MYAFRNTAILRATRLTQLLPICVAAIVLITSTLPLTAAHSEDRKLREKTFADMPVRLQEVRNLQSDEWPNDLEIEVENVSNRPIYFLNVVLEFPDDPTPNGTSGIVLKFGQLENMDISRIAKPEDERLDPGKAICFIVSEIYRKGLLAKQAKTPENFKRMELSFSIISFGDGTGFEASQFLDLRKRTRFLQELGSTSQQLSYRWRL
jgi:hypothetical protein